MPGTLVRIIVVAALSAVVGGQVAAQGAPASSSEARRWWIAVGADPYALDLRTRDPGVRGEVLAVAGRDIWRTRGDRVGARVLATFGSDLPRGVDVSSATCRECKFTYTRRFASLDVMATGGFAPRPGWQAYALVGPSANVVRTGGSQAGGAFTSVELGAAPLPQSHTFWSLGMSTGVGLGMPVAGGRLFVEQWLQAPGVLSREQSARDDNVRAPLVVGFRF